MKICVSRVRFAVLALALPAASAVLLVRTVEPSTRTLAVALGDLSGELSLEQVTAALSDFADAAIDDSLRFGRAWGEATLGSDAVRTGIAAFAGAKKP